MTNCNNCNNTIENKYCAFCGQSKSQNGRIDLKDFLLDIFHSIFHTGGGLFLTLKKLIFSPDEVVNGYVAGKRKTYFSPIKLILISGTIYILVSHYVNVGLKDLQTKTLEYYFQHYKYLIVFGPILIATLINWIIYRKKQFSIAEHFISSIFIFSILYLFNSLFMLVNKFIDGNLISISIIFSVLIYSYSMTKIYFSKKFLLGFLFNIFIYLIVTTIFILPFVFLIVK